MEIENKLNDLKFDLAYLNGNSALYEELLDLNKKLDHLITKVEKISKLLIEINKNLTEKLSKMSNVNDFLKDAGIPYELSIQKDYKIMLVPKDSNENKYPNLSFGEKNAISLILFTLSFIKSEDNKEDNNKLIIIDDPISSFDDMKKFAILYHLFSSSKTHHNNPWFEGNTVLLLTHDFPTIYLFLQDHSNFNKDKFNVNYLYRDEQDNLEEKILKSKDLINVVNYIKNNFKDENKDKFWRLLNVRNYLEMNNKKIQMNII